MIYKMSLTGNFDPSGFEIVSYYENNIDASEFQKLWVVGARNYCPDYTCQKDGLVTKMWISIDDSGNEFTQWVNNASGTLKFEIYVNGTEKFEGTAWTKGTFTSAGSASTDQSGAGRTIYMAYQTVEPPVSVKKNDFLQCYISTGSTFNPSGQMELCVDLGMVLL